MLGNAIALASELFRNKLDKGGKPYILHCLWVMDRVRHLGEVAMIVAVLHDVTEDTKVTLEDLKEAGYPPEVLNPLALLDHGPEVPYQEYIRRLALNDVARAVKMRDLEHNSKITRLKGVTQKDIDRAIKYHKAYIYLKNFK